MIAALVAAIPSPPSNGINLGPFRLHVYGLLIAIAIAVAVWVAQRRWERIGGGAGAATAVAMWGVPGGLIGARLYSVITSWQVDTGGHWYRAFEIWRGGLGIWGGVVGGIALGAYGAHRRGIRIAAFLDCVAPAFPLAQAIGRWGNYFNQELYGRPSNLPWAVHIDTAHRLPDHQLQATYQPTFLYECLWDLAVVGIVVWAERRLRIRRGYLVGVYAAAYTFGRFWTEYLRIDEAHRFFGLRLNDWTSIVVFAVAVVVVVWRGRAGPGDERAGDPLPRPALAAADTPRLAPASGGPPGGANEAGSPATDGPTGLPAGPPAAPSSLQTHRHPAPDGGAPT